MATDIHCPKCGGHFSSSESYQNHLPCGGSSTVGGAGDTGYYKKGKFEETEGGTGGGRPKN